MMTYDVVHSTSSQTRFLPCLLRCTALFGLFLPSSLLVYIYSQRLTPSAKTPATIRGKTGARILRQFAHPYSSIPSLDPSSVLTRRMTLYRYYSAEYKYSVIANFLVEIISRGATTRLNFRSLSINSILPPYRHL